MTTITTLKEITKEDVLNAMDLLRKMGNSLPDGFLPSTTYDVVYEGYSYPPVAVIGLAAERSVGTILRSQDGLRGGEGTPCFRALRNLGFEIRGKTPTESQPKVNIGLLELVTNIYPDEIGQKFTEGAGTLIVVNRYERNSASRAACIAHYGSQCSVCDLDFALEYGALGKGFIHVHHLRPLAGAQGEYLVDPILDLRPVCPNCHAMLHQRDPPLSIEELQQVRQRVNRP